MTVELSVLVETDDSVMPPSSHDSMVLRAVHGNRGVLPWARASDSAYCLGPPGTAPRNDNRTEAETWSWTDVLHEPCAGIDTSKRDAKVCAHPQPQTQGTFTQQTSLARTHLQHVPTAMACNVARVADWIDTAPRARRRTTHFRTPCSATA